MAEIPNKTETSDSGNGDQSHFSVTNLDKRLGEFIKESEELPPPLKDEKVKLQNYCTSLRKVEEWLLQMSCPFMSLSCLQISGLFFIEKQPSKYQIPLKEIRDYKNDIDDFKTSGCILVDVYKEQLLTTPQKRINQQLYDIQEGYNLLLLAAEHIQIPLKEIRDYKNDIDDFKNSGCILVDVYKEQLLTTLQKQINQQLSDIQEGYNLFLLAAEHIQFAKCSAWLSAMNSLVQSYAKLQIGLPEKKTCYQEFQGHLETIFNWQSEFDKLKDVKNDLLLNTHLDSSNSDAFMQSPDDYNTLIFMSDMVKNEMEHHFQEHQQQCMFDECIKLIDVSRAHLMEHLKTIIIETIKDNWTEFDMHSMKDQLLPNTFSNLSDSNAITQLSNDYSALVCHSEKILDKLKLYFQEHQRLECMYGECKNLIDMSLAGLKACYDAEVNRTGDMNTKLSNLKSLHSTLGQMQVTIQCIPELTEKVVLNTDVKGIKKAAENYSIMYKELLINIVEVVPKITSQRLEADHQLHPAAEYEISSQYETVIKMLNAHIVQLEVELEKYKNLYADVETFLHDVPIKLQNLEKAVDSQEAVQLKMTEFSSLKKSLLDGERLIKECTTLGETISNSSGLLGREQLAQKTSNINDTLNLIQKQVKDVEEKLNHSLAVWTKFEDAYHETTQLLEAFESDFKPSLEIAASYQDEINRLKLLKAFLDKAVEQEANINNVNQLYEKVVEVTTCTAVKDHALVLSVKHSTIKENLTDAINKLEKALQSEFSRTRELFSQWLNKNKTLLEANRNLGGNRNALERKRHNLKVIAESLPDGEQLLNTACDSGTKILDVLQESSKNVMCKQIEEMKQDFSNLRHSTSEVAEQLSSVLARLQEFAQNSSKFKDWIEDIEPKLEGCLIIEGDMEGIEKKLEYYNKIQGDITFHLSEMKVIQKESEELVETTSNQSHSLAINDLNKRLIAAVGVSEAELEDALQKFNHYKKNFQFCEKLVSELGPIFKEAKKDASHYSLENAKGKLDSVKKIFTKLTDAKNQLQNITQGCAEVITSISCLPSPGVCFSSSTLEKEMQIKVQLRDLMEQAQLDITYFSGIVDEWNSILQKKHSIGDWIVEKDKIILAMESAELSDSNILTDDHCLKEIKLQIEEKRSSIDEIEAKERKNNPDASEVDLKAKLKDLDDKVKNLIMCIAQKTKLNEVKPFFAEIENQTRLFNEKIDAIKMETGISQKQQLIQEISKELDSFIHGFKERKIFFFELKALLQDEDYQKLQADMVLAERKLDDLKGRILKEIQNFEMVQTTINDLQSKLSLIKEWFLKVLNEFTSLPQPGFQSENIKCSLKNISTLQREAKKRKLVVSSIEGQVVSIGTYVNKDCELSNELNVVNEKFEELLQVLESTANNLETILSKSIQMEKNAEILYKWFNEVTQFWHQAELRAIKLKDLEQTRSSYCNIINKIKEFEETRMKEIYKLGKDLEDACTSEHRRSLHSMLNEVQSKIDELKNQFEEKFEKVDGLVSQHKDLCDNQVKIQSSLNKIEVFLSEELKLDDGIQAIRKQKNECQSLFEETEKFSEEIERLQIISESIIEQICERDKHFLITKLRTQKEYHHKFRDTIRERLKTFEECILKQREMRVEELMVKIKQARSEIEAQNKFIRISSDETTELVPDSEEFVTVKERYHILIKELSAAVTTCREITCAISNTKQHSVHKKLGDLNTISSRVLNCETKLKEAQEICLQIAEESSTSDHNSIMDELQRLRNLLNELKELIQSLKTKYKQLVNERSKVCYDLNNCVKFLCQHQELLSSRPVLTSSKEIVQNEITKYQALLERIQDYQNVIDNVKSECSILEDKSPKFQGKINQKLINIQEGHNFLRSFVENIQTHLKDGLQRLCQCDKTLQSCEKLINDVGPSFEEAEMRYSSVEDVEEKLENYGKILTKLTAAEDQLENAVQECVVAITFKNRTSDADMEFSPTLVEKINEIEIQLRDSIKLTQSKLSLLPDVINEWKSLLNEKSLLEGWLIKEEKIILAMELSFSLSDDILTSDLHQLQETQQQIEGKLFTIDEIEAKERKLNSNAMEDDTRTKLKDLEKRVKNLTKERNGRKATYEVQLHLDEIEKRITLNEEKIDAVEKQTGVGPIEKQKLVDDISKELISIANHIEETESLADDLQPLLGDENYQKLQTDWMQIEENRVNLKERCMKMIGHLQSVQINQSNCVMELNAIGEWLLEKLSELRRLPPPGFQSDNIECRLRNISGLHDEAKDKVLNIFSVERRLSSLEKDIDNYESLYEKLKDVKEKIEELIHVLEPMASELKILAPKSIQMEKSIEEVFNWLTERQQFLYEMENAKANIELLKKAISTYNVLKDTFQTFEGTKIRKIYTFEKDLEKACISEHKDVLHSLLTGTQSQFDGLKKAFEEKFKEIDALVAQHENLCRLRAVIQSWLNKTVLLLSQKLNLNVDIKGFEEQRREHKSVLKEAEKLPAHIKQFKTLSEIIMKYMKEADKGVLISEIQTQTEHFNQLQKTIHERIQTLEEYILKQKNILAMTEKGTQDFEQLHSEIELLNKPIGISPDDAFGLVRNYEIILNTLEEKENQFRQLKPCGNLAQNLNNLIEKYNLAIRSVQEKQSKAKKSATTKDQYQTLIREITKTITTCKEAIPAVNEIKHSLDKKFGLYTAMHDEIINCERKISKAQDKGEQIGKENMSILNSVTCNVQKLKDELNGLKKLVQSLKTKHEQLIAERNKLCSDFRNFVELLLRYQDLMKLKPPLKRENILNEVSKYQGKAVEINKQLENAHTLRLRIDSELSFETDSTLLEQLNEFDVLQRTLPEVMKEHQEYLNTALCHLEEFDLAKKGLMQWFEEAENFLCESKSGIDIQNSSAKLERLEDFITNVNAKKDQLMHIEKLCAQVQISLEENQRSLLDGEVSNLKQKLTDISRLANMMLSETKIDVVACKQYLKLSEEVTYILNSLYLPTEKLTTLPDLEQVIENISKCLAGIQIHQSSIRDLNEKAKVLDERVNTSSKQIIRNQLLAINKQWEEILCKLENRLLVFKNIRIQFEMYTKVYLSVLQSVQDIECRFNKYNFIISKVLLEDSLTAFFQETKELKEPMDNVQSLLTNVLVSLAILPSDEISKQLQMDFQSLKERYQKLLTDTKSKLNQVREECETIKKLEIYLFSVESSIKTLKQKVKDLDYYINDVSAINKDMVEIRNDVTEITKKVKLIIEVTTEPFVTKKISMPATISKSLSSLEALLKSANNILENTERECEYAQSTRIEYSKAVVTVLAWLQKAQIQLQNKSILPEVALESIELLLSEIPTINEYLNAVCNNGQLIIENTTHLANREAVQSTLTFSKEQVSQINSWIHEKNKDIKDAIIAEENFLKLQDFVNSWIKEVERILPREMKTVSLQTLKCRLEELQVLDEKQNQTQQFLKEMRKCVEKITEVFIAGNLPDLLATLQQKQSLTYSYLQKEISLLEKAFVEWEKCEWKINEVSEWVEKTKAHLNSVQFGNRFSMEQLSSKNILLKEIQDYQNFVDDIKTKGVVLGEMYKGESPSMQDQISQQLTDIQESYNLLLLSTEDVQISTTTTTASPMNLELSHDENYTSNQEVEDTINHSRIRHYCDCILGSARPTFRIKALSILLLLGAAAMFSMSEEELSFQLFNKFGISFKPTFSFPYGPPPV